MAFTTNLPRGIGPLIDHNLNSLIRNTSSSNFTRSFGGLVNPGIHLHANLQFGGNSETSKTSNGKSDNSNGSGRGGRPHKSQNGSGQGGYYGLKERGVIPLTYNSGIKSGIVINGFEESQHGYSTCYIQSGEFFPNRDRNYNSEFHSNLNDYLYIYYLTRIQAVVNYRVDQDFTSDRFFKYFTSISSALQLYYMVDSIIAYCNHSSTVPKNRGLLNLRSKLTSEILSKHTLLGHTLKEYPIPINLLHYIRYMYQNFTFGEGENSPIYRLGYRFTLHDNISVASLSPDYYDIILKELSSDGNRVPSLLKKTFPDMNINELPLSSGEAIFDRNFQTFWTNSNVSYLDSLESKEVKFTRHVSDKEQRYNYFIYDEDVDGIFYASQSCYNTSTNIMESGLWLPINDVSRLTRAKSVQRSSLLCFNSDPDRFEIPSNDSNATQSGIYHAIYNNKEKIYGHIGVPVGCVKVQSNSLAELRQPVGSSVSFLFGLKS